MVIAAVLGSCGLHSEDYHDISTVCLDRDQPDAGFELTVDDGDSVTVTAILGRCEQSSTSWSEERCDLTVDGRQISVATSGSREWGNSTTKDCWDKTQLCGEVTLDGGEWTLVYGGADASFTVPYEGNRFCVTSVDSNRHN